MNVLRIIIFVLFLTSACGDSGTNSNPTQDSPDIPNVTANLPSFDYFKGKAVDNSSAATYQLAAALTASVEAIMTGFSSLPAGFMDAANSENATLTNGVWRWEYTSSGAGASVSIILTAEERLSDTYWEMLISASTPDISFENYKFIDGSIQIAGNAGEWNFYNFEEESSTPVLSYSWNIENEDMAEFLMTFGDFDYSTMSYQRSSPNNTLVITDENQQQNTIYWNSDTGAGYYDLSSEGRVCWDSTRNAVTCP